MRTIITTAALAATIASGQAATINPIEVWGGQSVSPAFGTVQPAGPPSALLTGGIAINFGLPAGGSGTLGEFASSAGWHAAAHAADPLSSGPDWISGSIFHVSGSISLAAGDVLTLEHDDGASLALDGVAVINQPGPTPAETGSYIVPTSGDYLYSVLYGECCVLPATLTMAVNGVPVSGAVGVPEPASWLMLGAGMLGLLGVRKRWQTRSAV